VCGDQPHKPTEGGRQRSTASILCANREHQRPLPEQRAIRRNQRCAWVVNVGRFSSGPIQFHNREIPARFELDDIRVTHVETTNVEPWHALRDFIHSALQHRRPQICAFGKRRALGVVAGERQLKTGAANEDGVRRCWWGGGADPAYRAYHDDEWGMPVTDDIRLFEKLTLEGFQSGLSWLTILRKRVAFREAFAGFDFRRVARFGDRDVERLLGDAAIVRHRGKIVSAINNARRAEELVDEAGSLAAFVWRFEPAASARPRRVTHGALAGVAHTDESRALAKELKRRG